MPATNRGMGQLTPTVDMTSSSRDYFKGPVPSWSTIQSGLAVFALFIIFRSCFRRAYSWYTGTSDYSQKSPSEILHERLDRSRGLDPTDWAMDEKRGSAAEAKTQHVTFEDSALAAKKKFAPDSKWKLGLDSAPRPLMSRPPPAPPLTPPELSTTIFTYEEGPRSHHSFIHQPNPDYMSASPAASASQSGSASPLTSRRRSYNKTLPIGIPVQNASSLEGDVADLTTSANSYPPTSPLLPPAPPGGPLLAESIKPRNIDVQGDIISMLDGEGAGWSRHTRVYGGGVCLACAAAGGNHDGGFYGATVSPEEMR